MQSNGIRRKIRRSSKGLRPTPLPNILHDQIARFRFALNSKFDLALQDPRSFGNDRHVKRRFSLSSTEPNDYGKLTTTKKIPFLRETCLVCCYFTILTLNFDFSQKIQGFPEIRNITTEFTRSFRAARGADICPRRSSRNRRRPQ